MELTHEETEKYIEYISSGIKIVDLDAKVILFKYPDMKSFLRARHIYDKEYKESIDEGLLSVDGMKKLIEDRNLITEEDRNKVSSLKAKLEGQKVLLAKTLKVKANQDRIKNVIHGLEDQIRKIEVKERAKFSMTAETRAEESKILYLCWGNSYYFGTEELVWADYESFLNEKSLDFRQRVVSEFILFYGGVPTPIIRAVARSNLWRIRYVSSVKTSEPLFGVPTTEYTGDMLNLSYWSHYYQNIYEMLPEDQPSEYIIEDDDALDAYLSDYYKERNQDAASRKSKRSNRGKLSAYDKQEVIVTKADEMYEDIEYDTPREAQRIKDRTLIKKKASSKNRAGTTPDDTRGSYRRTRQG
jgi:hypothetical protein